VDEANQAEVNREKGFGPSPTRRGEILIRHPALDLTKDTDMEIWQEMNFRAINGVKDRLKGIDPAIEIIRSLPGIRPKKQAP
jgi:hypothetical protein